MRNSRFAGRAVLAAAVVVGATLVSFIPVAQAATYDFFTNAGQNFGGNGPAGTVFNLELTTNGSNLITGVTGTFFGSPVTFVSGGTLFPAGDGSLAADPVLDLSGFDISTLIGNTVISASNNAPFPYSWFSTTFNFGNTGSATLAATPLPSTWLMLLSGFAGLGFVAYRGAKKRSPAIT